MRFATNVVAWALLVLNLPVGTGLAGSLVPDSKLKRELDAQLPAESRHTFAPGNEKWIKTIRYVDPVLFKEYKPEEVSEEGKKHFDKKEVLSMTGNEEGDRRVLTHNSAGKLRFIADWRSDDVFTQSLYTNGSIGQYTHSRKNKVIEAYSVSPRGSDVHRVVRGNGILKPYSDEPNSFMRAAYHGGVQFFSGYYLMGEKLESVSLTLNQDTLLRWRVGSEEFTIQDHRTWWGRATTKDPVKLKRLDGEFDLKKLDVERVKMWEDKYSEYIASFLDRYDAHLKKAGYTWGKLDIEFIRSGRPFPGE